MASSAAAPSARRGSLRMNLLSSASPPTLWHVRHFRTPTFAHTSSRKCAAASPAQPGPVYGFLSSARSEATEHAAAKTRTSERRLEGIAELVSRGRAEEAKLRRESD